MLTRCRDAFRLGGLLVALLGCRDGSSGEPDASAGGGGVGAAGAAGTLGPGGMSPIGGQGGAGGAVSGVGGAASGTGGMTAMPAFPECPLVNSQPPDGRWDCQVDLVESNCADTEAVQSAGDRFSHLVIATEEFESAQPGELGMDLTDAAGKPYTGRLSHGNGRVWGPLFPGAMGSDLPVRLYLVFVGDCLTGHVFDDPALAAGPGESCTAHYFVMCHSDDVP